MRPAKGNAGRFVCLHKDLTGFPSFFTAFLCKPLCSCKIALMDGERAHRPTTPPTNWQFKSQDTVDPDESSRQTKQPVVPRSDEYDVANHKVGSATNEDAITWSASEFIAHQKSFGWYSTLGAVALVAAAAVFLATNDKISTTVVLVAAVLLGVVAARKPRTLKYQVNGSGLTIGEKFYHYDTFRSFAVLDEGAFSSVVFIPLKRFMPLLTIYFEPKDEDKIVSILSDRLPMEVHKLDVVEQLMQRIRF
jgi:hypothetical protein